MYKIKSPLMVTLNHYAKTNKDKVFILNLNNYRNTFFRTLNTAKIKYKQTIVSQIENKPRYEKAGIIYKVYKGDSRRYDIGNILSVQQKFFEDALVECGKLPDDKAQLLPLVLFCNGGIDREEPRVDITIYNLMDELDVVSFKNDLLEEVDINV